MQVPTDVVLADTVVLTQSPPAPTLVHITMLSFILLLLLSRAESKPVEQNELRVSVGDEMLIECDIDNHEDNVVIWKHRNRVLFAGDIRVRHDDRIVVIGDDLVIKDVRADDAGLYKCEVEDAEGVYAKAVKEVVVLEPPVAHILQGSHLTVKAGVSLALRCVGAGTPLPTLRWIKGGRVLARGVGEAGVLLEYLTREDQGDITCEASDTLGNTHTDTLSLDILSPPEAEIFQPRILFQPQCGLELQCLVHSSSTPTVHWFHNDLLLQPMDGVTMWSLDNLHVMQIHSCDQKILGQFTCKAETSLGASEDSLVVEQDFIEEKMEEEMLREYSVNNVRRNVQHQEALPLVSSASNHFVTFTTVIFLISLLL